MVFKRSSLPVACLLLCCLGWLSSCRFLTVAPSVKPIVCLTFDDQHVGVYNTALPLMNAYGYRGTCYINTAALGQGNLMSLTQVTDLHHTYQWEIGGHSLNHENLVQLTYQEAEQNIAQDFQNLCAWGFNPRYFALPRGECPTAYYEHISSIYDYIRTSNDFTMFTPLNVLALGYLPFQTGWTAQNLKLRLSQGIANGESLIILGFHRLDEESTDYTANCPASEFSAILAYINELGLEVLPLSEAVDKLNK